MIVRQWGLIAACLTCWLLAGCEIRQGSLEQAKKGAPPPPAVAPVTTASATPPPPPPPAPAAKAAEPAKATESAKSDSETKADAKEPTSTEGAADALLGASRAALDQAALTAGGAKRRAEAEAFRAAQTERRNGWLTAAMSHQRHLAGQVTNHDALRAATHLALLGTALEAIRANLASEPAWDEVNYALGALYSVTDATTEAAAVKTAQEHLRRALEMLPQPTAKSDSALPAAGAKEPASSLTEADPAASDAGAMPAVSLTDPAGMAAQVAIVSDLLGRNALQARKRLQELVIALSDTTALEAMDLLEVSRRWLADALGRGNWASAKRNNDRLAASLTELAKVIAPPAAAATAQSAPPPAESSTPAEGAAPAGGSAKSAPPAAESASTGSATPPTPAAKQKSGHS
ncbi:MAG: hypothetical protein HZB16_12910 [Armatimonadetes bacterium]|nr:hypothetical protein [Armatimonadota bacterium]